MRRIAVLSLGNFFSAGHFFLIIYILAPYLATLMPAALSGLAIGIGAIITLAVFPFMPKLVCDYGPRRLGIVLAGLEFVVLLILAVNPSPFFAVLLAAIACAVSPFIAYQLDILLQAAVSDGGHMGRIRAGFLTAGNIALVLAPLITGFLLGNTDHYDRVFLVAALSLVPFMVLMGRDRLPQPDFNLKRTDLKSTCLCIMRDKDLRAIALANGVLQFFYHLAPLYIPLYLHTELGVPWSQLGWMFAVMLVPFVLLEYPAGWLADTKISDKHILSVGFVVMGLSLAATGLITDATSYASIAAVLVLSRAGAALVEAMVESHFFRRVTVKDTNTVSIFRMTRPAGALLAPVVGTILLSVTSYTWFFAATGIVVVLGGLLAAHALRVREVDTKCEPFGSCLRARA